MSLLELYCYVDDFWLRFVQQWEAEQLQSGEKHRRRAGKLCGSEIMTILSYFHSDQLKNISQIEHTCHRSLANFMVNVVCGLIGYSHQLSKPSLALDHPSA